MTFRFQTLTLHEFRCFEELELSLEDDLTVLFAENGGGKSTILTALAAGLTAFQTGTPRALKLDAQRDARKIARDERGRREPAGPCTLSWTAKVGEELVTWANTADPASNRKRSDYASVLGAMERVRTPGARWPLFAFYGVERMGRGRASTRPALARPDRWEGYSSSLDPAQDDSALLTWLLEEVLADSVRRMNDEPERFLAAAVMDTVASATPGVTRAWYDPAERSPVVRLETGAVVTWTELSDGFHVFLALVADLARRAVMLNEQDGGEAPSKVEGVVLIDELDLHLHPRWQRVVLDGLRTVFPRLQFVVTTHSPQVLSSALNRQVRLIRNGEVRQGTIYVEKRDSNSIMREYFGTDERDEEGVQKLAALDDVIDAGNADAARRQLTELLTLWGTLDTDLIRRKARVDRM